MKSMDIFGIGPSKVETNQSGKQAAADLEELSKQCRPRGGFHEAPIG
jgi:hypothetical protein